MHRDQATAETCSSSRHWPACCTVSHTLSHAVLTCRPPGLLRCTDYCTLQLLAARSAHRACSSEPAALHDILIKTCWLQAAHLQVLQSQLAKNQAKEVTVARWRHQVQQPESSLSGHERVLFRQPLVSAHRETSRVCYSLIR